MKLSEISVKPKLIKLDIDDKDVIEQYGEPIEFYVYDVQPMKTFMQMATVEDKGIGDLAEVVVDLVLDENGKPMIKDDEIPPAGIMVKVISKVIEQLGNSSSPIITK